MKIIPMEPLFIKGISELEDEVEKYGLSYILTYEETYDYIYGSYGIDKNKRLVYMCDIDDLIQFAYNLTLIERHEYEDFLIAHMLKVPM